MIRLIVVIVIVAMSFLAGLAIGRAVTKESMDKEVSFAKMTALDERAKLYAENTRLQDKKNELETSLQGAQEQVHWARIYGHSLAYKDTNQWAIQKYEVLMSNYEDYAQRGYITKWDRLGYDVFPLIQHFIGVNQMFGKIKPNYSMSAMHRMEQYLSRYVPKDDYSWQELRRLQSQLND